MKWRILISLLFLVLLFACNQPSNNAVLQNQVDSLQKALSNTYKPGLGEFMSGIQVHHAKLWFAGTNQNWELAAFEINEIDEAISDIKTYCSDRPETNSISMIEQPIANITAAIKSKDLTQFKNSYNVLTSTCNSCHQATNHAFNVIITPTAVPFTNQDFGNPGGKK